MAKCTGRVRAMQCHLRELSSAVQVSPTSLTGAVACEVFRGIQRTHGVSSTLDTNGRRNERDVLFGRWQVPLSIDCVRVYLPADNRLDFRRFLTGDIAQVQISKAMPRCSTARAARPTRSSTTRFESVLLE